MFEREKIKASFPIHSIASVDDVLNFNSTFGTLLFVLDKSPRRSRYSSPFSSKCILAMSTFLPVVVISEEGFSIFSKLASPLLSENGFLYFVLKTRDRRPGK